PIGAPGCRGESTNEPAHAANTIPTSPIGAEASALDGTVSENEACPSGSTSVEWKAPRCSAHAAISPDPGLMHVAYAKYTFLPAPLGSATSASSATVSPGSARGRSARTARTRSVSTTDADVKSFGAHITSIEHKRTRFTSHLASRNSAETADRRRNQGTSNRS